MFVSTRTLGAKLHTPGTEGYMSFGIYLLGFVILIVGLALAANMMHVPPRWIAVGTICMVGIGILAGVANTRRRDP